jgi:hypothetical protein
MFPAEDIRHFFHAAAAGICFSGVREMLIRGVFWMWYYAVHCILKYRIEKDYGRSQQE